VSGQFRVPAALPPHPPPPRVIASDTHWVGGWVGFRAGLDLLHTFSQTTASLRCLRHKQINTSVTNRITGPKYVYWQDQGGNRHSTEGVILPGLILITVQFRVSVLCGQY